MTPSDTLSDRVQRAIELFGIDDEGAIAALAPCYSDDMVFVDPIQEIHGKAGFLEANRRLTRRSRDMRMRVEAKEEQPHQIFMRWHLRYALRLMPAMEIEGVSHMEVRGGLVVRQQDFWDPLGAAMGAVPGLGFVYRRLTALFG
ncbi:MAG: nuclear transport factor 2 family protein [Deltaproteobacteria bacterium]|nr:nuclear transport factor 2 family protein [Deltaproteobacteria bacterium]